MAERPARRLLVVEDEINLGQTLSERLTRAGHEVVWTRSVAGAREELARQRFDLALLDIGLGDGSGLTLGELIQNKCPATAIIFLSAMGDTAHRIKGLEIGAEDFVVKPFNFQELLLRIENGLRRARFREDGLDRVRVGRAEVSFQSLEATVDGQSTRLGAREAALLRLLVERRGAVVSRDVILDEVWSRDEYPTPRTVDNFILKLRRLVEQTPDEPTVIRSIRGVGYQLDAAAVEEP